MMATQQTFQRIAQVHQQMKPVGYLQSAGGGGPIDEQPEQDTSIGEDEAR